MDLGIEQELAVVFEMVERERQRGVERSHIRGGIRITSEILT
jgi:hypothetical protein